MSKLKTIWQKFKKIIIGFLIGGTALAAGLSGIPQDLYNNLNVKVYSACNLQEAKITSIADSLTTLKARNPDNSLRELNAEERAKIKTCEMAKRGTEFIGIYDSSQYGTKIEIIGDVKAIEIKKHEVGDIFFLGDTQHGIELFARAWRGTQQLGFGADGSVEIERFRIFNPPILVDDPNGTIIRESINPDTQLVVQRKLREDPIEAIRQVIAHNAKIVGKDNGKIVIGKVGNTTSTFYPDADPENTSVDGYVSRGSVDETFSTLRSGVGTGFQDSNTPIWVQIQSSATTNQWAAINRMIILFDTAALSDTDSINSATFSLYVVSQENAFGGSPALDLVDSNPASNTGLANADYGNVGTVLQADAKLFSDITSSQYNDWTLNSTGLSNISITSVSKFGMRIDGDVTNTAPMTWTSNNYQALQGSAADTAGTTQDPKLVVEHTSPAVQGEQYLIIFE